MLLHIRENIYNLCKSLSILVSMYPPQINGVYALSLGFKLVGNVIICWKVSATKVILMDEKSKLMSFNALVTQIQLYGVEVGGGSISLNVWNDIEKIQSLYIHYQSQEYAKSCITTSSFECWM